MSRRVRLLAYNTFLLRIVRLPGGYEPAAKPAVSARAAELGRALAGQYDVAALTEVFDEEERRAILTGVGTGVRSAAGPLPGTRSVPVVGKSSGLFTLIDGPELVRRVRHAFAERGARHRDADAWASKGVLLVEVDVGAGANLEVYSTHLIYGNDFVKRSGGPHGANADVRQRQVEELLAFVATVHRPENVAVVVGDFNVPAHDPYETPPDRDHLALRDAFDRAGFDDVWATHGTGAGFTHFYDAPPGAICATDPAAPDFCVDPVELPPRAEATRIDYVWLQRPVAEHRVRADVATIRRRGFPREPGTDRYDELPFLSDHLGLHVELDLS